MTEEEIFDLKPDAGRMEPGGLVVTGGKLLSGGTPTVQFMLGVLDEEGKLGWISEGWRVRAGKLLEPRRQGGGRSYKTSWLLTKNMREVVKELVLVAYGDKFRGVHFPALGTADED